MKTGILWDLDGTLMDTLEDLRDGVNYALRKFGFPGRTLSEVRRFVGNGARNLMIRAAGTEENIDEILAAFHEYYDVHCQDKTRPYPGIPEALDALRAYPMAIVSNKPDVAVQPLCRKYFPGMYATGEISGCPRKPAPDMVFRTMEKLGVDRCVYVGDSEVDVLTAKNAGMPCLSVLWGFRDKEDMMAVGGEHFCEKCEDLAAMLEAMIRG